MSLLICHFLEDSRSPFFLKKNDLKMLQEKTLEMIPKCERAEPQSWS